MAHEAEPYSRIILDFSNQKKSYASVRKNSFQPFKILKFSEVSEISANFCEMLERQVILKNAHCL